MPQIVPYQSDFCEEILNIYRPHVETSAVSFESELPDLKSFDERLQTISNFYPFMVLQGDAGQVMGYAYANKHRERPAYRWAVETSIYMHESALGKGLGKILYNALMDELKKRMFHHAFGIITLPNHASENLHYKCGFEKLCIHKAAGFKLGNWHDVLWVRKQFSEIHSGHEPYWGSWTGKIILS